MPGVEEKDRDLSKLHPVVRGPIAATLNQLNQEGIPFRIFEAYRTPERQNHLYAQGRTRSGDIVTYQRAWGSFHQYGLAADFVLYINGGWSWDSSGSRRGWWTRLHEIGRANDLKRLDFELPHLQFRYLETGDLQAGRYPAGGDDGWADNLASSIRSWSGSPAAPPSPRGLAERPPLRAGIDWNDVPRMGASNWHGMIGGQTWRFDPQGIYLHTYQGGMQPLRTPGVPTTCRRILEYCGNDIAEAARKYGIPPELIVMTIATEAAAYRNERFTGPRTFRWEPNVRVDDVNPPRLGDYSAGPMQTLATTARWVIRQQRLPFDPFEVAPALEQRPPAPPADNPLYRHAINIELGTAEILQRRPTTGMDPILVAAAYNAGGLYASNANPWRLQSHGDHLDRAAQWYGDACAVLAEERARI